MPNTQQLKIGPLEDRTPVKLNIAVEPSLKHDLETYCRVYEKAYGERQDVAALIPSMLEAFLASDTGFKRARKTLTSSTT